MANAPPKPTAKKRRPFDKSLGTAASLSKLLPTGTTLAFQTMAPSFTKGGECSDHDVNFVFTWGLIGFLTLLSAVLSFTDSVTDKHGHTYYGVATPNGFWLFNNELKELELSENPRHLKRRMKMTPRDFLHALLSATVFMALAFCDAGVQDCLVRHESLLWKDFLTHVPLAVGFLASFVLIIFPSTRKGIGEEGVWDTPEEGADEDHKDKAGKEKGNTATTNAATTKQENKNYQAMGITQVAPSSACVEQELDSGLV